MVRKLIYFTAFMCVIISSTSCLREAPTLTTETIFSFENKTDMDVEILIYNIPQSYNPGVNDTLYIQPNYIQSFKQFISSQAIYYSLGADSVTFNYADGKSITHVYNKSCFHSLYKRSSYVIDTIDLEHYNLHYTITKADHDSIK